MLFVILLGFPIVFFRKLADCQWKLQRRIQAAEKKKNSPHRSYEVQQVQQKLSSHFGTRVGIKADGQFRGEIKIPFVSTEDLNRILEIIDL